MITVEKRVFEKLEQLKGHVNVILEENEAILNNLKTKDEYIEQIVKEFKIRTSK